MVLVLTLPGRPTRSCQCARGGRSYSAAAAAGATVSAGAASHTLVALLVGLARVPGAGAVRVRSSPTPLATASLAAGLPAVSVRAAVLSAVPASLLEAGFGVVPRRHGCPFDVGALGERMLDTLADAGGVDALGDAVKRHDAEIATFGGGIGDGGGEDRGEESRGEDDDGVELHGWDLNKNQCHARS